MEEGNRIDRFRCRVAVRWSWCAGFQGKAEGDDTTEMAAQVGRGSEAAHGDDCMCWPQVVG